MTRNKARKHANRSRAAATGLSYTEAHHTDPRGAGDPAVAERMRLTGASPEVAARMLYDARAHAAQFAPDDHSREAFRARNEAEIVEDWEQRRAGRLVRWWSVYVDLFAAALDEQEAADRLIYYQRTLFHYAPGISAEAWSLDLASPEPLTTLEGCEVLEVPAGELSAQRRHDLIADYPPAAWQLRHQPRSLFGAREQAHLDEYLAALHRSSTRLIEGPPTAQQTADLQRTRGVLPPDTPLRFFRAQRRTDVLAGPDEQSARQRGEQLAATVVDYLGRPVGELAAVEPDDGFRSATDGDWVHPAQHEHWKTVAGLWADYDAHHDAPEHTHAQAAALRRGAERIRDTWNNDRNDYIADEAKLHIHPDGTRTLSSPAELEQLEQRTLTEATKQRLTVQQLREHAEHDDYMASRVYGKVVETDDDVRRIERLHQRAQILRNRADQLDTQNPA